eukprot:2442970-Pleurochrysis_carterae.AAC.1
MVVASMAIDFNWQLTLCTYFTMVGLLRVTEPALCLSSCGRRPLRAQRCVVRLPRAAAQRLLVEPARFSTPGAAASNAWR